MPNVFTSRISNCRICYDSRLNTVFQLDKMPFTDEFIQLEDLGTEFLSNIEIGICQNCGSVQNLNDTDMHEYYNEYTYSVQSSGFAMAFMSLLAKRIKSNFFSNQSSPKVLEIGSGSGEQLKEFQLLGFEVIGIEPSQKLSDYANSNNILTLPIFFDENTTEVINSNFKKVDLVITSYTFDHIPMPSPVLENIHNILNDGGILVIEVHDLDLIKQRNEFCLFEHEHYTYLNEKTITYLLEKSGFEVLSFDILNQSEKRANSLLVVAKKLQDSKVCKIINIENEIVNSKSLSSNIFNALEKFQNWLELNASKNIAAYGAGGRGIMTIAALKNPSFIKYIVDKNPKAENIYSPKSHLPVFSIDKLGESRVDLIIVFSFGYFDEIVEEVSRKYEYDKNQFISILDLLAK